MGNQKPKHLKSGKKSTGKASPAPNDDINQGHNTKKVSLGPNTNR